MQEGSQLPGQEDVTITAQEKLGRPGAARGMSAVREINVPTASSTARDLSHLHHSVHEVSSIEECTVVKRDGMLVPFRRDRVQRAIELAFRATNEIPENDPLPKAIFQEVKRVTDQVVEACFEQARSGACLTVEGIQDVVEQQLLEGGHYEVGRRYIAYRDERRLRREDSPRNLKLYRRDGKTLVRFNPLKIATAIELAFRATNNIEGATPQQIIDAVNLLTTKVVQRALQLHREGQVLQVEMLQDEIERQMMAEGFFQVAKDFIIYRSTRAALRAKGVGKSGELTVEKKPVVPPVTEDPGRSFPVTARDGSTFEITERELRTRISFACRGYEEVVDAEALLSESLQNFYVGIKAEEVDFSNIMAAKARIEKEPDYTYVAARLLRDVIYRETIGCDAHNPNLHKLHGEYLKKCLQRAVELERIDPALLQYDLPVIAAALDLDRDDQFTYLGLQTLYDRYLIHHEGRKLETPQIFWMRVAMGLAINEGENREARAIEFYNVLSQFRFVSSTPTLFNSGTLHPQLSSCYLSTVKDDLKHIFKVVSDDAQLSKWAGGLGNDWTNVRATGSWIKGTNGTSQGVIPFLKVANDTAVAVNQGGKRKGAMCAYLETWHLDIEDFIELRKNTGDERRRTHDMNTANWIPDLFMKRVVENGHWTLFSPSDVPDLHDLYGMAFEKRYAEYEKMTETGELKLYKRIEAVALWRKMLSMLFETGHPWITFKDPSNLRSPQDHVGVVHSSNLCTEILLNTSAEETAVCNLGSVNLVAHLRKCEGESGVDYNANVVLDEELLAATVRTAMRMLDNVIDINFYPTIEAKNSNLRHRPVGLGLMGFQDALYEKRISYASQEAVRFADESMEMISYYAILASTELAAERGKYASYDGSKWDRGFLPIDTVQLLANERGGEWVDVDSSSRLDWNVVREAVKRNGMRNSNTMAIAPTATISNITGVTQSIEPSYKHLFVKSNLSGEFTVSNTYLVNQLKELGMWDVDMIDDLKYFDGSILEIERIPDDVKLIYLTAFEIEPEWIIECASRRQKWIDMGQSLNLYLSEPSGKKLHDMYTVAWRKGLKTTYYLRSLGATQIEKSTMDINKRGLQPRWMKNKSASADIAVERESAQAAAAPEAASGARREGGAAAMPVASCNLDGDCESCQ
ncbi:MAG: ribonucleoside-diphosphate reductase subunit alpha [Bdellovibrionales bacterium]|nr:ribonucleoside-diphosphate reductase subunit alpha [Bdellovibrionales bacterium]